jgi:beta-fructofuranosidase
MFDPDDRWIWDFWHVNDGTVHHLYFLQAPRSLGDSELRHRNATIGHATSTDLITWTEHGTVLTPGDEGAVDETATWTGSIVRGEDGLWRMFYTGSTFLNADDNTNIEAITVAVSDDLYTWRKDPNVVIRPDPVWYERLGDSSWPEEAWRDPWVYQADGGIWHMLITARAKTGDIDDRGVVGHAVSVDLVKWTVQPPLTQPGAGFGQLEVLQLVTIDDENFIIFSTQASTLTDARRSRGGDTGVWFAPVRDGVFVVAEAAPLSAPDLYSGRAIQYQDEMVLLAFRAGADQDGAFLGGVTSPLALEHKTNGLKLKGVHAHES